MSEGLIPRLSQAPRRVFYGWWIVLAAAAMNIYGAGVWFYGFPVFFPKILQEFGWSRAATAGAFAVSRIEGGLEAPIVGYLVDRFGPRKLAIIGSLVAGLGFMAMSRVNSFTVGTSEVSAIVAFYFVFVVLISVGYNTGFGHTAQPTIANWFIRKRSRAFAFWSLGAGASGITVATLGWLIEILGWRQSAFLVGIGMFLVVVPLALVLRHKPEQYGYLPDGEPLEGDMRLERESDLLVGRSGQLTFSGEYDFTVKQALATSGFWFLLVSSGFRSIAMTAIIIHEVAYLEDVGFSFEVAKNAIAMMVLFSLVGRFSFGWLGDFFEKRYVLMAAYALQILGVLILDNVRTMIQLWVFVVVYAIGYGGAIPVWTAMRGEYFGRKHFATIGGIIQFLLMPAAVFGPVYAGWVFDTTQSYHDAFMSFILALAAGLVCTYFAKRPKPPVPVEKVLAQVN